MSWDVGGWNAWDWLTVGVAFLGIVRAVVMSRRLRAPRQSRPMADATIRELSDQLAGGLIDSAEFDRRSRELQEQPPAPHATGRSSA